MSEGVFFVRGFFGNFKADDNHNRRHTVGKGMDGISNQGHTIRVLVQPVNPVSPHNGY